MIQLIHRLTYPLTLFLIIITSSKVEIDLVLEL